MPKRAAASQATRESTSKRRRVQAVARVDTAAPDPDPIDNRGTAWCFVDSCRLLKMAPLLGYARTGNILGRTALSCRLQAMHVRHRDKGHFDFLKCLQYNDREFRHARLYNPKCPGGFSDAVKKVVYKWATMKRNQHLLVLDHKNTLRNIAREAAKEAKRRARKRAELQETEASAPETPPVKPAPKQTKPKGRNNAAKNTKKQVPARNNMAILSTGTSHAAVQGNVATVMTSALPAAVQGNEQAASTSPVPKNTLGFRPAGTFLSTPQMTELEGQYNEVRSEVKNAALILTSILEMELSSLEENARKKEAARRERAAWMESAPVQETGRRVGTAAYHQTPRRSTVRDLIN